MYLRFAASASGHAYGSCGESLGVWQQFEPFRAAVFLKGVATEVMSCGSERQLKYGLPS